MDSFEWFGDIGNQQFDSLKPPGDIQRETFNAATMGLESFGGPGGGGGGGDDDAAEKQYEYDLDLYDYNNLTADRNYEQQMLANVMQRRHIADVAEYHD